MKIWISSFIPKNIKDYTLPVPDGGGKTMIPGPTIINDCFYTDQRDFSNSPDASSRLRSLVEVDLKNMVVKNHIPSCDETIECDCEDGEIECVKSASTKKIVLTDKVTSSFHLNFILNGAANNPCFAGSPNINWIIHVHIDKSQGNKVTVEATTDSRVEKFPSYEMYAEYKGETKTVFRRKHDKGSTPGDLVGETPNQPVAGIATFPYP